MNALEGARRMQVVGRWIVFIALTVVLVIWGMVMLSQLAGKFLPLGILGGSLPLIALLAIPGGGLWLAGWIVEGFAKK